MSSLTLIVPGPLDTLTGGSIYDRRIAEGLRLRGWAVDVRELEGAFPWPSPADLDAAARVFATIPDRATVLVDGLALGAMPDVVEREASRLRIVALVHMPLASEVGITADAVRRLQAGERRALAAAVHVVVTGWSTADRIEPYGVPRSRISVVEPGADRAPVARGSGRPELQLLCVATINPGKGHEILIRALSANRGLPWTLSCVGSVRRAPATYERLQALVHAEGLDTRVTFAGEQSGEALESSYAASDVFVLATLRETYGMAVAEAIAHGLPVVSTTTGSIPSLVGDGAGLLVAPGDADAFRSALSRVLAEPHLHADLRAGALRMRERLQTWDAAADTMGAVLDDIHG